MAVLTGIPGMEMGDGSAGKIALSLTTRILRILADGGHSWLTASMRNPAEVTAGSVTYYTPEIIQTEDYGTGATAFDSTETGITTMTLDIRRTAKYTYETFDVSRLDNSASILGMIATGQAMAIQADLNAHFLTHIVTALTTTLKTQNTVLADLVDTTGTITPEDSRKYLNILQYQLAKFSKLYDKRKMGVDKAEFLCIFDPIGDVNLRNAFWSQLGGLDMVLSGTLAGVKLGTLKYIVDNMMNNKVDLATSFSKDQTLDTTNFVGIMIHNEAVAMPFNYNAMITVIDPVNGNPRFISKYQFGIGIIRPDLLWGFVKTIPTRDANGKVTTPTTSSTNKPVTLPKNISVGNDEEKES